jgi:aminopeptidase-like protein
MIKLIKDLYPLHRTLNHVDNYEALNLINNYIGHDRFKINEYESGSEVWDWKVPKRFVVNHAYLINDKDEVIIDVNVNPLHIVSYSHSIKEKIDFESLSKHLYYDENNPNAIPWIYQYYNDTWGLCLSKNKFDTLDKKSSYFVDIDVSFTDEPMPIGEFFIPGKFKTEILIVTNICHPYQVNDSISGVVIAAKIAKELKDKVLQNGIRFLFVPESIGTVAWLANNEDKIQNIKFALSFDCLGAGGELKLQQSLYGNSYIDFIAKDIANKRNYQIALFREYMSNDESILSASGVEIPTIAFTRAPYKEYHTSEDTPDIISTNKLDESYETIYSVVRSLAFDSIPRQKIKGFLFLKKHNLWTHGVSNTRFYVKEIFQILNGKLSIYEISYILGLDFMEVYSLIQQCVEKNLIELREINNEQNELPKLPKI